MSCAAHGSGRSHRVFRRSVHGVRPRVSPTASRMSCTEISAGVRFSTNPPPGPRMDLIRPAFFSLKKICSRNSEETFSSDGDGSDRDRAAVIRPGKVDDCPQAIPAFRGNSHSVEAPLWIYYCQ